MKNIKSKCIKKKIFIEIYAKEKKYYDLDVHTFTCVFIAYGKYCIRYQPVKIEHPFLITCQILPFTKIYFIKIIPRD